MQFTKIEPPNLLYQIISQIKRNLATGELRKGDKLPSERHLCTAFGLSRATVREALKTLEILGLVECLHGSGYYISSNLCNTMSEPLSIMMLVERGSILHTHELRRALEQESAALAATHASDADIAIMETLIAHINMEQDEQVKAALDQQFHYALARASGNPLLVTLLNEHIHDARILIIQSDNEMLINRQHEAILAAIKKRSSKAAAAAMKEHMELIAASLIQ